MGTDTGQFPKHFQMAATDMAFKEMNDGQQILAVEEY